MKFSGERYTPEIHGNIELEHFHRYLIACEISEAKDVLDIASGEGYGTSMLAVNAKHAIGVDISNEAVNHARYKYQSNNLEFIQGDCVDIPMPDNSIDLVVSFETIEHIDQPGQMLGEIKRVLREDGVLIISTPDKYHYSIESDYVNVFHKKEFYENEFKELLDEHFLNHIHYQQRIVYGSWIVPTNIPTTTMSYTKMSDSFNKKIGINKPLYHIILASNTKIPIINISCFEQPIESSEILQSWKKTVNEKDLSIQSLVLDLAERDKAIQQLTADLAEREQDLLFYANSKSWQITRPLRKLKKLLKGNK